MFHTVDRHLDLWPKSSFNLKLTVVAIFVLVLGNPRFENSATAVEVEIASPNSSSRPVQAGAYKSMLQAISRCKTLSYSSHYRRFAGDQLQGECIYRVWLQKPNFFRVEVRAVGSRQVLAILIGDGDNAWLYWPNGRPQWDFPGQDAQTAEKNWMKSYMKSPAIAGKFSIGHSLDYAGGGMSFPIINPSVLFGLTSSLDEFITSEESRGTAIVAGIKCQTFVVNIMDDQRQIEIWQAISDQLPRKLRQSVHVDTDYIFEESWSDVQVGENIDKEMFSWTPPSDWHRWQPPEFDDLLLKSGTAAPPFRLNGLDGNPVSVPPDTKCITWLYFWRVGCPPCRKGLAKLQKIHTRYHDQGLQVVGFNDTDERQIAASFVKEVSATFPLIVDSSPVAQDISMSQYRCSGVPVNYIIGKDGKVVDAWYGNDDHYERAMQAVKRAGLDVVF
jgi:peroxiredoxin